METRNYLGQKVAEVLHQLYGTQQPNVIIENTKQDFEGDYTFVVFPFLKASKKSPEQTATEIGNQLKAQVPELESFNVIKGFLNLTLSNTYWLGWLTQELRNTGFGFAKPGSGKRMLVEYSSPNTNKPLHLGHVRNILLGYSVSEILKANGHIVNTCNLVNDRGIHICKSMLAWQKFGQGENPESSGLKGDHLVGKYYVEFDKHYKAEISQLIAGGISEEEADNKSALMQEAKEMLRKWETGDAKTIDLWKKMNGWVYDGFDITYKKLGVHFDTYYYESDTYLLGKDLVNEGLEKGVFFKKDDGSVWIDLTAEGLDQKLLLRSDGTSVYITQDIGTAELKYKDFVYDTSVYVVANEQDYHFKVLKLICSKLGKAYADGIYHLSYGMVELPHGKMKSREGTVVDADDLVAEMIETAKETTQALGKTEGLNEEELNELYETVGLGAMKYFLLKVDPKKKMLFNPAESIDFHGNTGPFIQYTHARIKSILRNAGDTDYTTFDIRDSELNSFEKELLFLALQFPETLQESGREMSPGLICNYVFELAKCFNQFYHECPILRETDTNRKHMRLALAGFTASIIKTSFALLGIRVPERM